MNTFPQLRLALDQIVADPRNPNVMDPVIYGKVREDIRRTGRYPPAVVRELPPSSRFYDRGAAQGPQYMYLDGYHRGNILRDLGEEEINATNWGELPDDAAGLYLGNLNYLTGEADTGRLSALYHDLSETLTFDQIASVVPFDVQTVEELVELRLEHIASPDLPDTKDPEEEPGDVAKPMRFMLYPAQHRTVSMALDVIAQSLEGNNKQAQSLEMLAVEYLAGISEERRAEAELNYKKQISGAGEEDPLEGEGYAGE